MVKALHPLGPISSRLELPPGVRVPLVHDVDPPAGQNLSLAVADPAAAARRALESPLKYPPLSEGVVPGDQLAIALDEAVPDATNVVRGAIAAAEAAGIEPGAITVVACDEDFCKSLREGLGEAVRVVVHDPEDPVNLALLGLNEKNERLLVNRSIFEADVVLPIGCARLSGVAGCGVFESLFPRLSDTETIGRLRTPSQWSSATRIAKSQRKADEAGWLLGVALVMQVVPGVDGTVAEVVAGDPRAVAERCQQLCEALWSFRVPQRASLVIANVTGRSQEQTWENIGRALAAVEPLVEEGGAVAICSDLDAGPGHALGQLVGNSDFADVERDVRNDHSPDSWPAWQLARALQRGPVYFLSQLDADDAEQMGFAPIAHLDELARLASRQETCIVLDDSQFAVATVSDETVAGES
ncbi:MAG: lactate racemase domain-containing protein [Pirellulales bacterium]